MVAVEVEIYGEFPAETLAVPVGMRLYGIPGGYHLWGISIFHLQFTAREVLPTIEGKVNADETESKVLNNRRFIGR